MLIDALYQYAIESGISGLRILRDYKEKTLCWLMLGKLRVIRMNMTKYITGGIHTYEDFIEEFEAFMIEEAFGLSRKLMAT